MEWKVYDPELKKERKIDVDFKLHGEFHPGTRIEPPEAPEVEIVKVYDEKGKEIPESLWEKIGFTAAEQEEFKEEVLTRGWEEWERREGGLLEGEKDPHCAWIEKFLEGIGLQNVTCEVEKLQGERYRYWVSGVSEAEPVGGVDLLFVRGVEGLEKHFREEGGDVLVDGEMEREGERVDWKFVVDVSWRRPTDMDMEELKFLAGLPTRKEKRMEAPSKGDREVLREWRKLALGRGTLTEETSELSGDVVPPGFTFPDPLAFYGYAAQKLPLTLQRSVERMTPEGKRTVEEALEELRGMREVVDRLVELFDEMVSAIDTYDAGSIEGREVARVFRYLKDAARFVQGGVEVAEVL